MNREDATNLVETTINELAEALEQGRSEALTNYLSLLARFHDYSFRNSLLILMQRPDATHVAGFHRWRQMGRFVKKGEKGIAILAPLVYRKKSDTDEKPASDDEKEVTILRGFKVAFVFDVSQTDGEELPQFATLSGDPAEKLPQIEALIRSQGIELKYEPIGGGALGVSRGGEIAVAPNVSPAETFSVLVHELAHELLHKGDRKAQVGKKVKETEAEAVAFVVTRAIGLDPTTRSADYIQLYSGDKEVLMESLDYIQKTAHFILSALNGSPCDQEVPHAA
jgi:antirestriction protein ArdC